MSIKQSDMENQVSIQKLKQENELLLGMLDQYRILFNHSQEAFIVIDSNAKFTEMNDATCLLLEQPKEKLINMDIHTFLMLESIEMISVYKRTLHEKGVVKGDIVIRVKSGKIKQVEFTVQKSVITGVYISILRDVSRKKVIQRQRKVSKQLLMDVYNRAVDGIVIFDRTGSFVNCNQSFLKSFELTKEELLKSTIYDFVVPDHLYEVEKSWRLLDEKERAKGEVCIKLKNGVKKTFEFSTTANIYDHHYMSIMRDVTEKRNMEKKLENSELRFRDIFDVALDAIVISDDSGKIINANSSACKLFEMPIENLTKVKVLDFVDHDPALELLKKELKETGKLRAELDFHMVNGQTKRLEFTARYRVLDGYNMTIFRNVSETRLMEKNIRESEEKFRRIFEGALDGIILWDEDLRIIDVNPVACEILKVDRKQFLSSKMKNNLTGESQSSHDTRGPYVETPFVLESGEERVIEFAVKSGVIPNLNMTIFRDVTERKNIEMILRESELKFRKLYDNALNGFIIIEDEGNIVGMNPEAKRIFGLKDEVMLPLQLQSFAFSEDITREKKWQELLENTNHSDQFIVNNRIIEYTLSKNIYKNHHLAILQDVTDRKELEEKLKKTDTLTVVGELAAGIAHEIRNPMTALKGFIQLLKGNVNEDFTMYFDIISSEFKKIESIITEFLILAKPQAIQYKRCDIKKILNDSTDLLSPQAALQNIQFITSVDVESTNLYCEPNQLKQVFINILKNGIEVMPEGGIIRTSINQSKNDVMIISFNDQGCGISEEKIKRLGEPFYTTKERGTGLGLMVSYKIIAEHNGRIEVVSKEGTGTTFHIYIPTSQIERL